MKILLLSSDLSAKGGIQTYSRFFFRACGELGIPCTSYQLKGVTWLEKIKFLSTVLSGTIREPKCFIFASHIGFAPLCYLLKACFQIRYAIILHGIESWGNLSKFRRSALAAADCIISVSKFTREKILSRTSSVKKNVHILPGTFDENRFMIAHNQQTLRQRYGISHDREILLTVCRLEQSEQYKGYDRVIHALPEIIKKVPTVLYILIGDGNDMNRIIELVKSLRLEKHVLLTGSVPDTELPAYYNLCNAFIMPSAGEGFGIVFLEALACGKPVIAGNADASPEALLFGELGILVNPLAGDEIYRAAISLLSHHANQKLYNPVFLREITIEHFGFETFKRKLGTIIHSL